MTEDFPRDVKEVPQLNQDSNLKRKRNLDDSEEKPDKKIKIKKSVKTKNDFHCRPFQSHIEQNMLVLGCVKEVRDYEVIVSLPNEMTGKFSITEVSEVYTDKLKKLAAGQFYEDDSKPLGLHDIFHVGLVVRCFITEFLQDLKKTIILSVKPSLVNQYISDFKEGMVLPAVVASCEDHGYMLDVGHKNLTAFLPKSEITKYMEAYKHHFDTELILSVGSYLTCVVKDKKNKTETKSRSLSLSIDPSKMKKAITYKFSLFSLMPGSLVKCTVKSADELCLIVSMGTFDGIIFHRHLLKGITTYEVGEELFASVLYVQSSTKYVVLSELSHLTSPNTFPHIFKSNERGDIVDAKVVRQSGNEGIFFKLPDNLRGFISRRHLSDHKQVNLKKFMKNEVYRARIIGFNYLEKIVVMSMKKSVLEQEYYNYEDLKAGLVLECSVERFVNKGVRVKVMGKLTGLIPFAHMSDIPLLKPEKKFTHGKKLKCKVLYVNADDSVLILTNKKSLVKSKYPVPCSYADLSLGLHVTGFVGSIKDNGLVVVFCDEVKGWVPKDELTFGEVGKPSEMFFIGQVVQCKVLKMIPLKKKLLLSLKVSKSTAVESGNENGKKAVNKSEDAKGEAGVNEDAKDKVDRKSNFTKTTTQNTYLVLPTSNKFDWENEEGMEEKSNEGVTENKDYKKSFMKKMRSQLTSDEEKRLLLERATILKPADSVSWLELIAFEVENVSVEKAREVVQKALKSIPYREEQEKFNIWMSYINLEFQYGSEDSLKGVVDEAMKQCEQIKVMAHTRDMYESAGKLEKSLEVCRAMAKKFKEHPDTWASYGRVLYHMGELQKARKLLAESLERVDKRQHIEVTTKFALLEAKYGLVEESERIFNGILDNFPRRTDIWAVYTDMLVKHSRIDEARRAFKKFSEVDMPLKKRKFALKKVLAFEERYGDEESVLEVKERLEGIDNDKNED